MVLITLISVDLSLVSLRCFRCCISILSAAPQILQGDSRILVSLILCINVSKGSRVAYTIALPYLVVRAYLSLRYSALSVLGLSKITVLGFNFPGTVTFNGFPYLVKTCFSDK